MKILKTFESYKDNINNKIKSLRKIKEIVDFIERYDMTYFVVAMEMEDEDYMFEDISKDGDVYKLEYTNYNKSNKSRRVDLLQLPDEDVEVLYRCCKEFHRFDIEYHLETGVEVETFINILKKYKKPIKFNSWMFGLFLENDKQDEANSFKFQDILFLTHPEAYEPFIDECFDSLVRSKTHNFEPLKLHPKIRTKYKDLLGEYYHKKEVEYEAGKYNL